MSEFRNDDYINFLKEDIKELIPFIKGGINNKDALLKKYGENPDLDELVSYALAEIKFWDNNFDVPIYIQELLMAIRTQNKPIIKISLDERIGLIVNLIDKIDKQIAKARNENDNIILILIYLQELFKNFEVLSYQKIKMEEQNSIKINWDNLKFFLYKYIKVQLKPEVDDFCFILVLTLENLRKVLTSLKNLFTYNTYPYVRKLHEQVDEYCNIMRYMYSLKMMLTYINHIMLETNSSNSAMDKCAILRASTVIGEQIHKMPNNDLKKDFSSRISCKEQKYFYDIRIFMLKSKKHQISDEAIAILRKDLKKLFNIIEADYKYHELRMIASALNVIMENRNFPQISESLKSLEISNIQRLPALLAKHPSMNEQSFQLRFIQIIKSTQLINNDCNDLRTEILAFCKEIKSQIEPKLNFSLPGLNPDGPDTTYQPVNLDELLKQTLTKLDNNNDASEKLCSCLETLMSILFERLRKDDKMQPSQNNYLEFEYPFLLACDLRNHLAHDNWINHVLDINVFHAMKWYALQELNKTSEKKEKKPKTKKKCTINIRNQRRSIDMESKKRFIKFMEGLYHDLINQY